MITSLGADHLLNAPGDVGVVAKMLNENSKLNENLGNFIAIGLACKHPV